jgi:hypothetical protein
LAVGLPDGHGIPTRIQKLTKTVKNGTKSLGVLTGCMGAISLTVLQSRK